MKRVEGGGEFNERKNKAIKEQERGILAFSLKNVRAEKSHYIKPERG